VLLIEEIAFSQYDPSSPRAETLCRAVPGKSRRCVVHRSGDGNQRINVAGVTSQSNRPDIPSHGDESHEDRSKDPKPETRPGRSPKIPRRDDLCHAQYQPKGPVALRIARVLGVSADYILDESAPYPPPLESLLQPTVEEDSKVTIELNLQEKKILDAIRRLSPEERSTISDIIAAGSLDLQALRTLAVKKGLLIEDDE